MSERELTFDRRLRPLLAVLALVGVLALVSNVGRRSLMGPAPPDHLELVWEAPFFLLLLALGTWRVLRREDVTLDEVSLGRAAFVPDVLAFACFWAVLALAGVGYLLTTGAPGEVGYAFEVPWYWLVVWVSLALLANGLVEEFVFRGYVQSKCIALADRYTRHPAVAVVIVLAAASFTCRRR